MNPKPVIYCRPLALLDIILSADYLRIEAGHAIAEKFIYCAEQGIDQLSKMPGIEPIVPVSIDPILYPIRCKQLENFDYGIYYTFKENSLSSMLEIFRVLHVKQDRWNIIRGQEG